MLYRNSILFGGCCGSVCMPLRARPAFFMRSPADLKERPRIPSSSKEPLNKIALYSALLCFISILAEYRAVFVSKHKF